MRHKQTTSTTLVLEALIRADDFHTGRQLKEKLGLDVNHVSAALYHLRKYRAVDFVETEKTLWWFATPADDLRSRVVYERAPEIKPRTPRRRREKKHD